MITSRSNEKLKLVRRLTRRRERDATGLFVAEGEDLVDAAAKAGIDPVELLVSGENVAPDVLTGVSTLPHPARVIGVYRRADLPRGTRDVQLALWRVADPGNVGTLLRTADAFDAALALSDGCADPTGPKAVRASAGAIFRVPVLSWAETPTRRVALVAHGGTPLSELDLEPPLAFLLGSEREGLPPSLVPDHKATVPLPGPAESLNVAAAGAIALYELTRRRKSRTGNR
jgi:TrmH family RNA methyltransferase